MFKKKYTSEPIVIASAPGRLDFLNTHQDYKGLPVVSVGINLRTYVAIGYSKDDYFRVYTNTLSQMDSFKSGELKLTDNKGFFGDYVRAAIINLTKHGHSIPPLNIYIDSEVPISSGLGSSAALEVSIIGAISKLLDLKLSVKDIAELAFEAENQIMGIPCGRLDQYGSAYGGIIVINTRPPYNVEELAFKKGVFIVIDSGIRHSTANIHPFRQMEIDKGLQELLKQHLPYSLRSKLGEKYWMPNWEQIDENEISPFLSKINPVSAKRILFTLKMHKSTLLAIKIMRGEDIKLEELKMILELGQKRIFEQEDRDLKMLGAVLTYQHKLLDELYDVSLPELNKIVDEVIINGAYGAKLSGAGLGGAIIGLVNTEDRALSILNKIQGNLAPRGWIVSIDQGLQTIRW